MYFTKQNTDKILVTVVIRNNGFQNENCVATVTLPTGLSLYAAPVIPQGTWNDPDWEIGTMIGDTYLVFYLPVEVDDISQADFEIEIDVTGDNADGTPLNNTIIKNIGEVEGDPVDNILYVSKAEGNDTTGERGNRHRPWENFETALEDAPDGSVVRVLDGTHTVNDTVDETLTKNKAVKIVGDIGTTLNFNVTETILGWESPVGSEENIEIDADRVTWNGTTEYGVIVHRLTENPLNIKIREAEAIEGHLFNSQCTSDQTFDGVVSPVNVYIDYMYWRNKSSLGAKALTPVNQIYGNDNIYIGTVQANTTVYTTDQLNDLFSYNWTTASMQEVAMNFVIGNLVSTSNIYNIFNIHTDTAFQNSSINFKIESLNYQSSQNFGSNYGNAGVVERYYLVSIASGEFEDNVVNIEVNGISNTGIIGAIHGKRCIYNISSNGFWKGNSEGACVMLDPNTLGGADSPTTGCRVNIRGTFKSSGWPVVLEMGSDDTEDNILSLQGTFICDNASHPTINIKNSFLVLEPSTSIFSEYTYCIDTWEDIAGGTRFAVGNPTITTKLGVYSNKAVGPNVVEDPLFSNVDVQATLK